ncbi:MAG: 2-amino-4-hydroxy-6-hydroxymethyldihydropteridine diphosphokinase [Flavobacteriales bacterium]|nr:2-amino-4-hydroxy-6-hydroxymethyldihydropteridine diphosphokinase [Flavobacteriales bacterium]
MPCLLSNVKRTHTAPLKHGLYLRPMSDGIRKYVLLTGSDLGDRKSVLEQASELISERIGVILDRSDILETEPWGFESDTTFLNQALLVESDKKPEEVLSRILGIELQLGRKRTCDRWTSRTIDIDILCAEELIHHSDSLTIPHRLLHERAFALQPLCQLVPGWTHPLLHKTYHQLLTEVGTSQFKDVKSNP